MFGRKKKSDAQETSMAPAATSQIPPVNEYDQEFASPVEPDAGITIHEEPSGPSPPLFVKLDRYRDIQTRLQELKTHSGNMRKTLDKLAESNKKLQFSLSMSYNTLERINQTLNFLESRFSGKALGTQNISAPPLRSLSPPSPAASEVPLNEEMESYIRGIASQVEKIKGDLKKTR